MKSVILKIILGSAVVSAVAVGSVTVMKPLWFKKFSKKISHRQIASQKENDSQTNSTTLSDNDDQKDSTTLSDLVDSMRQDRSINTYELQQDANTICRSRGSVQNAANTYDNFVYKCNHPPYGVRYTDCNQYNVDQMGYEVKRIVANRNTNEIDFVQKWGSDRLRAISCY